MVLWIKLSQCKYEYYSSDPRTQMKAQQSDMVPACNPSNQKTRTIALEQTHYQDQPELVAISMFSKKKKKSVSINKFGKKSRKTPNINFRLQHAPIYTCKSGGILPPLLHSFYSSQ